MSDNPNATHSLPKHIAAIDMGSNSFHMVVATTSHGEVRTLDQLGEKVQLGAGLDRYGNLSEEAQDRAIECLERFRQRIRDLDSSSVQVVGTNALRVAKNRTKFLRKAEKTIGFPIEIISGREEARLIYLGVAHTLADDSGKRLVIDIGGGSTEFIIGERFKTIALESLHMGCVSYRDKFFADGQMTKNSFKAAITEASRELLSIQMRYRDIGWQSAVGSSGSIKAVFQVIENLGLNQGDINIEVLKEVKNHLIMLESSDRLGELGVKKERESIFAAGFSILYAAFKTFDIKDMDYTSGALREGLLYDLIGRIKHEDVRERSVNAMQKRYNVDQKQSERVELTVMHIFDQVSLAWGLDDPLDRRLLRWASRLFEVGMSIAHTQYHKHGAYLILHSDLSGFTRLSQLHLSTIVRAHRRKFSSSIFDNMKSSEKERLEKLCVIFRLAVVLTGARFSAETKVKIKCYDKKLSLTFEEGWLDEHPLTQANLVNEQEYLSARSFCLSFK